MCTTICVRRHNFANRIILKLFTSQLWVHSTREIWPFARSIQWQNVIFISKPAQWKSNDYSSSNNSTNSNNGNNNESYNDDNILVNILIPDFVYHRHRSQSTAEAAVVTPKYIFSSIAPSTAMPYRIIFAFLPRSFTWEGLCRLPSIFLTIQLAALYDISDHKLFHFLCLCALLYSSTHKFLSNSQEVEHWVPCNIIIIQYTSVLNLYVYFRLAHKDCL